MGQRVLHRPKILTLLHLWWTRRPALQYDWCRVWGGPWNPKLMPAYAAWPMLREILKDRSSHSFAALAGWSYIPDPADKYIHAANQGASRLRRRPTWEKPDPLTTATTPAARRVHAHDESLRDKLRIRLGIRPGNEGD